MYILNLHRWDLSPSEAIALQKDIAPRIVAQPLDRSKTRLIAGVDVSSSKDNPLLTAGIVVWDRETNTVVDKVACQEPAPFPYVPGLLSFREIPVLAKAIGQLTTEPDVVMVDGHGISHPRRLGIAAHLGLLIDRPTIGVAKSRLCGTHDAPGPNPGDSAPLMHREEHIGTVLRTKLRSNPLYIAIGNRVTLEDAVWLVFQSLRGYRLPEPTRLAHVYVNEVRRATHD